jgi:hypothetical protein
MVLSDKAVGRQGGDMTWRPQSLPPVPEAAVAAVRAAFPQGNPYVDLRTALDTLDDEQLCAALSPHRGRPVSRLRGDGATCRAHTASDATRGGDKNE